MDNDIIISENEENNFPTSSGGFGWDKDENKEYKYDDGFVSIIKDIPKGFFRTELCRHIKDLKPDSNPRNNGFYTGVLSYAIEVIGDDSTSYVCLHCILEAIERYKIPDFDKL